MENANAVPAGVQELIDRLKSDGVEAGRSEAERIVLEAKAKAEEIVAKARREQEDLERSTRERIAAEQAAAREALELAIRDARLKLTAEIMARFSSRVKRLVSLKLRHKDLLRKVILAISAGAVPEEERDKEIELFVSEALFGEAPSGASGDNEKISRELVLGVCQEVLREGIEITFVPGGAAGVRVRPVGEDLEVDVTEEGVSELLLSHLLPKFRELYEGTGSES